MRRGVIGIATLNWVVFCLSACHLNESSKAAMSDTALKTTADTTIIPGTPGPSGTKPGSGDTTQAFRDSLNMEKHISDSSGRSTSKPK